jgi:flagella basal body P-ring formation protein FlgA
LRGVFDEAIQKNLIEHGLPRFARNDGKNKFIVTIRIIYMRHLALLISLILITLCGSAYSSDVQIVSDCVTLSDLLGATYPESEVQCGFMPGDSKTVPAGSVLTSLKRNALPTPDLPESFTVIRAGKQLDASTLTLELAELYQTAYPNKKIEVDNIRLTRDVYLAPNASYSLEADTGKFGAGYGSIVSGGVRVNFSYNVRLYEEAYIIIRGLRAGDELAGAVRKGMVDVTNLRTELVQDIDGLVAARSATKGKVLTADMVQTRPELDKGDMVMLVYDKDGIKLEIQCIAQGKAIVGKTFHVRSTATGKVFSAVYIGGGRADVR